MEEALRKTAIPWNVTDYAAMAFRGAKLFYTGGTKYQPMAESPDPVSYFESFFPAKN